LNYHGGKEKLRDLRSIEIKQMKERMLDNCKLQDAKINNLITLFTNEMFIHQNSMKEYINKEKINLNEKMNLMESRFKSQIEGRITSLRAEFLRSLMKR